MVATTQGVRDVPANQFITAYAAHLKSNDKVLSSDTRGARYNCMHDYLAIPNRSSDRVWSLYLMMGSSYCQGRGGLHFSAVGHRFYLLFQPIAVNIWRGLSIGVFSFEGFTQPTAMVNVADLRL